MTTQTQPGAAWLEQLTNSQPALTVAEAYSAFDEDLAGSVASKTWRWYGTMLRPLIEQHGDTAVTDVTLRQLTELRHVAETAGQSPHSIDGMVRATRRFFNWLIEHGHLTVNPAAKLRRPRLPKGKPKAISAGDLKKLLEYTARTSKRDYAIVCFLADTGCRVGGLAGLTLDNLHVDEGRAYVTEKGDRTRPVFFSGVTAAALTAYLEKRPEHESGRVWIGKYGPLSEHGVYQMLRRRAEQAGIDGRVNPHSFRHAFARQFLQNGGDLSSLSQIMGHSSSEITSDHYSQFASHELHEIYNKYSPLAPAGPEHQVSDNSALLAEIAQLRQALRVAQAPAIDKSALAKKLAGELAAVIADALADV